MEGLLGLGGEGGFFRPGGGVGLLGLGGGGGGLGFTGKGSILGPAGSERGVISDKGDVLGKGGVLRPRGGEGGLLGLQHVVDFKPCSIFKFGDRLFIGWYSIFKINFEGIYYIFKLDYFVSKNFIFTFHLVDNGVCWWRRHHCESRFVFYKRLFQMDDGREWRLFYMVVEMRRFNLAKKCFKGFCGSHCRNKI